MFSVVDIFFFLIVLSNVDPLLYIFNGFCSLLVFSVFSPESMNAMRWGYNKEKEIGPF